MYKMRTLQLHRTPQSPKPHHQPPSPKPCRAGRNMWQSHATPRLCTISTDVGGNARRSEAAKRSPTPGINAFGAQGFHWDLGFRVWGSGLMG